MIGAAVLELAKLVAALNESGEAWNLIGYVDDDEARWGTTVGGLPVLGGLDRVQDPELADAALAISIGAVAARRRVVERLGPDAERIATLVHPGVDVRGATIGVGALVFDRAILGPGAVVGDHSLVSFGCMLTHDVAIGRFCNVSPGTILNGRVRAGDGVYFGAASVVIPDVTIGDDATIGAGAVVVRPVAAGETVFGNPARTIARR